METISDGSFINCSLLQRSFPRAAHNRQPTLTWGKWSGMAGNATLNSSLGKPGRESGTLGESRETEEQHRSKSPKTGTAGCSKPGSTSPFMYTMVFMNAPWQPIPIILDPSLIQDMADMADSDHTYINRPVRSL
jgi:hypothetical protein